MFVKSISRSSGDANKFNMIANNIVKGIMEKITSKNFLAGVVANGNIVVELKKIRTTRDKDGIISSMRNAQIGYTTNITQDLQQALSTLQKNTDGVVENTTMTLFITKTPSPTDLFTIRSLQALGITVAPVALGKNADISKLHEVTGTVRVLDDDNDLGNVIDDIIGKSEGKQVFLAQKENGENRERAL